MQVVEKRYWNGFYTNAATLVVTAFCFIKKILFLTMRYGVLLFLLFFLGGCGLQEREEALQIRETELAQREALLYQREQALAAREAEITRQTQLADSLAQDTLLRFEPRLIGRWNTRMTCTETTCPGSAIGDTKTEIWEFSYEGNRLLVHAIVKDRVVRIYSGQNTVNGIQLVEEVMPTDGTPTRITVKLSLKDDNTLEGQREILREDDCRIVYALQLKKQTGPPTP